ncbi:hypothetical protein AVEN_250640-1 [Araneus ventricosus]|uniref:Uncharacterized protein n=1 Tax=Araneus ventricosus TaxID=182803 RepID=A0A4Y2JET0_ARAVE|nr:hypothetical protein AVEN_250640-1 [Araneus ventricosus]
MVKPCSSSSNDLGGGLRAENLSSKIVQRCAIGFSTAIWAVMWIMDLIPISHTSQTDHHGTHAGQCDQRVRSLPKP